MTKAKFTPMPWTKTKTVSGLPKIVDRNGFAICHCKEYGATGSANFDLIAQAPAMFDALYVLSDALEKDKSGWDATVFQIRKILSAAMGETTKP